MFGDIGTLISEDEDVEDVVVALDDDILCTNSDFTADPREVHYFQTIKDLVEVTANGLRANFGKKNELKTGCISCMTLKVMRRLCSNQQGKSPKG